MKLFFFENIASPHQVPYIRECCNLSGVDEVWLFVAETDIRSRLDMGWDSSDLNIGNVKLIIDASEEKAFNILNSNRNTECIALFSGIRAFPKVFEWFKLSLKFPKLRRYIITEPPFIWRHPLWMHKLRYFFQDYRYRHYIEGYFCFGQLAVDYYNGIYKHWKVFPFQYVTEYHKRTLPSPNGNLKILYVGSLSLRKNVGLMLDAANGLPSLEIGIVGDGDCKDKLLRKSKNYTLSAKFYGTQKMEEIPNIMEQYDILILPSLYDGWGAVINEAMTLGLYVICSQACGASALIRNIKDGMIFKNNSVDNLRSCIIRSQNNKDMLREDLNLRLNNAKRIGGKEAAKYLVSCLEK